MQLTTPWALVLLALLPAFALTGRARLGRLPGRRAQLALGLRLTIAGLLILALASPEWRTLQPQVSNVFVIDTSASVGAAAQRSALAWAAQAVVSAGPRDQAAEILFGAAPRLTVPLAHYAQLPDPQGGPAGETDIGSALRLALSILPLHGAGRITLLSDGQATAGETASAVALAIQRGIQIDTVIPALLPQRDVAVRAIDLPSIARSGDTIPIHMTVYSSKPATATLTLWIDGAMAQQQVALPVGNTVLATEKSFDTLGVHTVRVRVDTPGDTLPQNNQLDAATIIAPPGRILFAVHDPAAAIDLATTLARAHLALTPVLASNLPATTAGYRGYDGVILDNVPATAMSRQQQVALRNAVHDNGLGLLVVGGDSAFGDGSYVHTRLEDALPVYSISTPRNVTAPVALMLVIDKSGSMADEVDGVAKMDMVKVAASSALDKLTDGDAVGVLAFDDTNHWVVPFHALHGAQDKAQIRAQINTLDAGGDTYIYPALQDAERALLTINTTYRHVVLLTDGQGEDAPFNSLINRMRREHITLSTIGVGQDVLQDELRSWAKLGGGIFHYVSDPHAIPRIIVSETRYGTSGGGEVRGKIQLGVAAASPLLRSLAGTALPSIVAYDAAAPKPSSQVAVQSAAGDPLLASWQYGLGRVATWSSDAGSSWSPGWSTRTVPAFWSDLARWIVRGYTPAEPVPQLRQHDGQIQITLSLNNSDGSFNDDAAPQVRVANPDGSAQVATLSLIGPGQYGAMIPGNAPGIYTGALVSNDSRNRSPADVAALVIPYAAEYADNGVDTAALTALSDATGGRVLTRPADAFSHDGLPGAVTWQPLWPLLLALALLIFPLDVAVRLLVRPDVRYRSEPAS